MSRRSSADTSSGCLLFWTGVELRTNAGHLRGVRNKELQQRPGRFQWKSTNEVVQSEVVDTRHLMAPHLELSLNPLSWYCSTFENLRNDGSLKAADHRQGR